MSNNPEINIVAPEDAGIRIDNYLCSVYSTFSRSFIQKQIKLSNIRVNNVNTKAAYVLKADDVITCSFDIATDSQLREQNIPLDIKYEDSDLLVVNKPSNMLTHPTSTERTDTLVNALLYYTKGTLSDCNGKDRPGIVHRLDRNTSGLLLISKNNVCYEFLKSQMQSRSIEKHYYALVSGVLKSDEGTICTNIGRHPTKPEKMAVVDTGKPSVTHYKVLERFNNSTLLDIRLETGRTHQIRVHMSHIGHPIINDTLYGGSKLPAKTNGQALQAYSIKFISPQNNEQKYIEIPIDNDIMKAINYLRSTK